MWTNPRGRTYISNYSHFTKVYPIHIPIDIHRTLTQFGLYGRIMKLKLIFLIITFAWYFKANQRYYDVNMKLNEDHVISDMIRGKIYQIYIENLGWLFINCRFLLRIDITLFV